MEVVYFDSSALVKTVLHEPDSDRARTVWDAAGTCVTSWLSSAEVAAALGAARRARRLSVAGLRRAQDAWTVRQQAMMHVQLGREVGELAADLAVRRGLRGADAVQLASALVLGGDVVFACWDKRLRNAATAEGLAVAAGEVREA